MCGISAFKSKTGKKGGIRLLVQSLGVLSNRGYDSQGIGFVDHQDSTVNVIRSASREGEKPDSCVNMLKDKLNESYDNGFQV